MKAAERLGAIAAFDVDRIENPVELVRQLTEGGRGADSVIEAVGRAITWEWALQMVRKGGTVNLFGGCPTGTEVKIDPAALHYSEITIKSTFHHTPQFMREAHGYDCARRNSLQRLHHRRSDVARIAESLSGHEEPKRRIEDCCHSLTLCRKSGHHAAHTGT